MPDKRATHATERILLPRKDREQQRREKEKKKREALSISQRADTPVIKEGDPESDLDAGRRSTAISGIFATNDAT